MLRRRALIDGVLLEQRDDHGELIAEVVVPKHLESMARKMIALLKTEHELSADRPPPGVLKFRRILRLEAIPRHSRASQP